MDVVKGAASGEVSLNVTLYVGMLTNILLVALTGMKTYNERANMPRRVHDMHIWRMLHRVKG